MNNVSYFDATKFSSISTPSTSIFTNNDKKNYQVNSKLSGMDFSIVNSTNNCADDCLQYNEELFLNFGEILSNLKQDPFEAIDKFEEILTKISEKIVDRSSIWLLEVDSKLTLIRNELETWSLVNTLYKDRITYFDDTHSNLPYNMHISETQLTNNLFREDAAVRQAQIIVDWLENCYRSNNLNAKNPLKFRLDRTSTCENTLHILRQNYGSTGNNLAGELDPDVATRTKKKLLDLDGEDEQQLLLFVIFCLRAGMLDKACDACISVGQMWRAITLEGWKLYHDSNMENIQHNNHLEPTKGNKHRILWKKVCWNILKEPGISTAEKAIYAILSGCLDHALPYFTASWHDRLWAHLKIFVEQRVEMNLSTKFIPLQTLSNLPEIYFNKSLTFEQIFAEIESSSPRIKIESDFRIHQIQKFLILGDISSLIDYMHSWCVDSSCKPQPQFLRLMVHLVLFMRAINIIDFNYEKSTVILVSFVELLISLNYRNLVAAYISYLPIDYQIMLYAKFLEGVKNSAARFEYLNAARSHNIDITKVTKMIVENKIKNIHFDINDDIDIASEISEFDNELIESIEWMLIEPLQRGDAILQVNVMFRYLLAANKLTACFKLSKLFPSNSIAIILSNNGCKTTKDLPSLDQNNIREFICYKSYLESLEAYEDWYEIFKKMRPLKIGDSSGSSFAEKVAHEQKSKQFQTDYKRWFNSANAKAQFAIDKLNLVLMLPEGRWLDDICESTQNDVRSLQLSNLRQSCLPATCFRLHKVLHDMQRYKEAIRLADIVACERYQLNQVFSVEKLNKLMNLISESSIQLLVKHNDPLGYN